MAVVHSFVAFVALWLTLATAQSGPGQFTLTVYQPDSPLDGQVVNAADEAFYLGGSPGTYCPVTESVLCPAGNQTIFAGMSALSVSALCQCYFPILTRRNRLKSQVVSKSIPPRPVLSPLHKRTLQPSLLELISATSPTLLLPVTAVPRSTLSTGNLPRPPVVSPRVRFLSFFIALPSLTFDRRYSSLSACSI
jgi:hypothetical protein